jgi:tetratricopeptide (TPR) repeat protein
LPAALTAYRASLGIAETLAKRDPGNSEWQRDLSVSHDRIGDVLRAQGDLPAALTAYRASLAIRETLAKRDPGNSEWQRDLIVSYVKLNETTGDKAYVKKALDIAQAMQQRGTLAPSDAWMVDALKRMLKP